MIVCWPILMLHSLYVLIWSTSYLSHHQLRCLPIVSCLGDPKVCFYLSACSEAVLKPFKIVMNYWKDPEIWLGVSIPPFAGMLDAKARLLTTEQDLVKSKLAVKQDWRCQVWLELLVCTKASGKVISSIIKLGSLIKDCIVMTSTSRWHIRNLQSAYSSEINLMCISIRNCYRIPTNVFGHIGYLTLSHSLFCYWLAGIAFKGNIFGADEAKQTIDTNFEGTRSVCEALIPLMANPGRIVNVCSMAGKQKQIKDPQLLKRFQVWIS